MPNLEDIIIPPDAFTYAKPPATLAVAEMRKNLADVLNSAYYRRNITIVTNHGETRNLIIHPDDGKLMKAFREAGRPLEKIIPILLKMPKNEVAALLGLSGFEASPS